MLPPTRANASPSSCCNFANTAVAQLHVTATARSDTPTGIVAFQFKFVAEAYNLQAWHCGAFLGPHGCHALYESLLLT